jgi:hypothetical protein
MGPPTELDADGNTATHGAAWLPAPEPAREQTLDQQRSLPEQRSLAGVDGDNINLQQIFTEDPGMAVLARSLAQSHAAGQRRLPRIDRPSAVVGSVPTGGASVRKRCVSFSLDSEDSLTSARSRDHSGTLADQSKDQQPTDRWPTDDTARSHRAADGAPPPRGASRPRAEANGELRRPAAEPQLSTSASSETVSADADLEDDSPIAFQRRLERELGQQLDRHRVDSALQLQALQLRKLGDGSEALPPPVQLMSLQAASGLLRAPSGDVSRVYRARVGPELRATCPMLCAAFPYGSTACVLRPTPPACRPVAHYSVTAACCACLAAKGFVL